jgi:F-type H+-transporting ATPase subunit epsilon
MVDSGRELQCVIVSPERALFDEPANFVAVPMYDGELGVLPSRAPLIGRLGYGELRVKRGEQTTRFFVDGGFVQVRDNVVTVLTSRALRAEEIQPAEARRRLDEARAALHEAAGSAAQDAATKRIDRERALLRIADRA